MFIDNVHYKESVQFSIFEVMESYSWATSDSEKMGR